MPGSTWFEFVLKISASTRKNQPAVQDRTEL
jgi:hypothetical protein